MVGAAGIKLKRVRETDPVATFKISNHDFSAPVFAPGAMGTGGARDTAARDETASLLKRIARDR